LRPAKPLAILVETMVEFDERAQGVRTDTELQRWRLRLPGLPKATAGVLLAIALGFVLTEFVNPSLFVLRPGLRGLLQPWRLVTQAFVTTTPLSLVLALGATWWSVGVLEEDRGPKQALRFVLTGAAAAGVVGLVLEGVHGPRTLVFAALGALVWSRLRVGVRLSAHQRVEGTTLAALLLCSTVILEAPLGLGPLVSVWAAVVAGALCAHRAGYSISVVARTYDQPVPDWLSQLANRVDAAAQEHGIRSVGQLLRTQLHKEVREIRQASFRAADAPLRCGDCGEETSLAERFCSACGAYQPPASALQPPTGNASLAFLVLAALSLYFVVGGLTDFRVIWDQRQAFVEATATPIPDSITAAEKQRIIESNERRSSFWKKDALLALGMKSSVGLLLLALAFRSKRAPFSALVAAFVIYLSVTVATIVQAPAGPPLAWIGRVFIVTTFVAAIRRTYVFPRGDTRGA
jgi:membrane associated rhomboid family serine protease